MKQANIFERRKIKKESGVQSTHSEVEEKVVEQIKSDIETEKHTNSIKEKRKKSIKTKSKLFKLSEEENDKLNNYLKENDLYFSDLVRDMLIDKDIF